MQTQSHYMNLTSKRGEPPVISRVQVGVGSTEAHRRSNVLFMHWYVQIVLVSELTRKFKGSLCMIYAIYKRYKGSGFWLLLEL